ncbi:Regulator of nonsense transcripts 1-like [Hondaea fermentalgiana]|uniref:Regulator of nonsense transcripts 1-like n=1 Tax=Hondaea fermentalgiana TaxID=2315210 RepID=A0A2R5GVN2_9STRA|nr:Regulator of nonsense transcripts 1-like [Hondaea fermentalgiana]|eukprot:GBG34625.1 Regulator of nonsense transcripts 1-like [Hondaea fermentalgiana]
MLPAQTMHLALRFRQQGPWDLSRNCVHAFPADDAGNEYLKVFQQRSADIVCEEMQASLDSFADFLTRGGSKKRLQERYDENCTLFRTMPRPRASDTSPRESFCGLLAGNARAEVMANNAMHEVAAQFKLNQDQQAVLRRTKAWLLDEKTDPVILVHGAYGAGKTQLSVAAIVFLTRVLDTIGDQTVRICVAAATNVAVDNVLKGLKRHGFDAFNRVGSIRNMDQELLEHALHYSERGLAAAVQDARAQLTDLARDTLRTTRSAGPSQALRYLEKTPLTKLAKEQQRREMQCRVVGVTCCSSSREFMMQTFQKPGVRTICLIDEAAQAVEALSMLPLVRTRAQVAMLVGDPLQLPPLTATQAIPQCAQKSSSSTMPSSHAAPKRYADGATSMFDRLRRLGREPVRLSVQYRCHPRISEISSKLFYDGKVRSGICAADRPALLAGLPAVGFYDVGAVNEKRTTDGSFVNEREQSLVCMMISKLIEAGVRPEQIGAIALYRAQAEAIESRLQAGGRANGVAVSTVDAFQGAERDVILISTCRTSGPGFTACPRRVNVMITRARHHLVILGRRDALCVSRLWRDVLQQCDTQTSLEGVLQHLNDAALEAREHAFDEDLELERELHGG